MSVLVVPGEVLLRDGKVIQAESSIVDSINLESDFGALNLQHIL